MRTMREGELPGLNAEREGDAAAALPRQMTSSSAAAATGGSRKRPRGAEESDEAKLARVEPFNEQLQQRALELASGDLSDWQRRARCSRRCSSAA